MPSKRPSLIDVAYICIGAVFLAIGLYQITTVVLGRSVTLASRLRALEPALLGTALLLLAFPSKSKSIITLITSVLAAAVGVAFYRVRRDPLQNIMALSGLVIYLYVVGIGLRNLYLFDWDPMVRLVAAIARGRWKSQYRLGNLHYSRREPEMAMEVLRKARARGLQSEWLDYLEAAIRIHMTEYVQAKKLLLQVITSSTSIPKAHFLLGISNFELGEIEDAREHLSRWLETNENDERGLLIRGYIHLETDQFESAISDFSRVLREVPSHSEALYNRGVCYHRIGNVASARSDWTVASRLDVPHPRAFLELANLAFSDGDRATAVKLWSKACTIDPSLLRFA